MGYHHPMPRKTSTAKVLRLVPIATIGAALLFALAAQVSAEGSWARASIAPHRAIYAITMDRASPGSGVADMTGRMVYEMSGSRCKGYEQKMRFVTRMTNQQGIAQINDLRTSSFEDLATHHLRFNSSPYENQKLSEASQGSAGPSNGATFTKVELTKPSKKIVKLPSDIYFPIQHSLALLEAAHSGKTIFAANHGRSPSVISSPDLAGLRCSLRMSSHSCFMKMACRPTCLSIMVTLLSVANSKS
jgi:hypothetical protein